jgi:N-acetylglucosaminyldiphosphoundecaprenol N-acetyl-beta-D-mannosaminyltransferase
VATTRTAPALSRHQTACSCCRGLERTATVNGIGIDAIRVADLPGRIDTFVRCGESHVVHFCPAEPTVIARRHPAYREILNRGALNVPDGMSVVWTLRLLGHDAERVYGPDVLLQLCDAGRASGLRHFLYGGYPHALDALCGRLEARFPGVRIVGAESPPFGSLTRADVSAAADRMRAAHADLAWVGLGTPKQDVVADRLGQEGAAPVLLCVGAAFDFVSGTKRQAPVWMQRSGLEWAFRLACEPRRLWRRYLVGNVHFVAGVTADRFRGELR